MCVAAVAAVGFLPSGTAQAQSFSELLTQALESNDGIKAAEAAVEASDHAVRVAVGGWYPTIGLATGHGHEDQNKPSGSEDTSSSFSTVSLSGSQLLWDNLVTHETIRLAELQAELARLNYDRTRRTVLFEALQAFLDYRRNFTAHRLSIQSVDNSVRQVKTEEALLAEASSTHKELLTVKVKLAQSEAAEIADKGLLTIAMNRVSNVFKMEPEAVAEFGEPRLPQELMPISLDEAIALSRENSLVILVARKELKIARLSAKIAKRTLWGASVNFTGEYNYKRDEGGTLGHKTETIFGVQAEVPLYNGGRDEAGYAAAMQLAQQSESTLRELEQDYEERVRNTWEAISTLDDTKDSLRNQWELADELLAIAEKENEEQGGTLGFVLVAEAESLSSKRAALIADMAARLGKFQMLFDAGALDIDAFPE